MQILLKSVKIIDSKSSFHLQQKDILITDGVISKIADRIDATSDSKAFDCDGYSVSIGWFDMNAHFHDPGHEYKEDLFSGMSAASAGGFTDVAILPNTNPPIDTKNQVEYVLSKSSSYPVNLRPISAVTHSCEGKELTEMIDLSEAGAIAFSDGLKPISNTDILLKTLQYLQRFDGLLINRPEDQQLNMFGTMHEGTVSTTLGLKGMPSIAESLMIQRDLKILEYTGGKIHFSNISTAESVELIAEAKSQGLKVSCDVAAHQLVLDDELIEQYDSNYKVNPPLRLKEDRLALVQGVKDGTIDVIVSSHQPHDPECKELEFDLADFGVIGLQTVFPLIREISKESELPELIDKISRTPRVLLGLDIPTIEVNQEAVLTIFDPDMTWVFDSTTNKSKSVNSPFYGKELEGCSVGIVNGSRSYFSDLLEKQSI